MLNIIYGAAGSGKSTYIYDRIKKLAEDGKEVVFFVPDQFSFEAEKIIYRTVEHKSYKNVAVTTFSKEAKRILREHGETKEYADDIVKNILMLKAVNEVSSEGGIDYYTRQVGKQGFSRLMLEVIGELRSEGITPSALNGILSAQNDFSDTLMRKLSDIYQIYSRYDLSLGADFNDRLDDIRRAAELISQTGSVKGKYCFFDGFDNFSGSQLGFVISVIENSEETGVAVTTDSMVSEKSHFRSATGLIKRLTEKTADNYTETKCTGEYRKNREVTTLTASDVWQECDWICAEIRRLMDGGERLKDIAVLTAEKSYVEILDSALRKYEIPAFTDIPVSLISKSVVKFPIYALRALSFETSDILRYVKSGYVRGVNGKVISNIDCDSLERTARKYDLRKKDWKKEFPAGLDKDGKLESLRKAVIEPLSQLKLQLTRSDDGSQMTRALCEFVCNDMDINKTIYGKCIETDEKTGKPKVNSRKLDEYCSLWEDILTVFESAERALKGYRLTLGEYIAMLTEIFTDVKISRPPQVLDAVTVGDTARSRFSGIKTVFICGFIRGSFPRPTQVSDAFTGSELQALSEAGVSVSADRAERFSRELYEVYRAVMLPEKKLYMTYPKNNEKFAATQQSPYFKEISAAFKAKELTATDFGAEFYCRTEKSAQSYLSQIYGENGRTAEKNGLIGYVGREFGDMLGIASGKKVNSDKYRIAEKDNANRLLSLRAYSPTALNTISECFFKFYGKYGLELSDERERDISAALIGDFVHYCLFRLLSNYIDKRDEFVVLSDEALEACIRDIEKEYNEKNFFGDFGGSARFSYQLSRLTQPAFKAARRIRNELKNSRFYPVALEEQLEFDFGNIRIKGRCDRRDSYTDENGTEYTRVIDYKRGEHKISAETVKEGKDMQMLLYLFAICDVSSAKPSSVMYNIIGKNSVNSAKKTDIDEAVKEAEREDVKSHVPTGFYLENSPDESEIASRNDVYRDRYKKAFINMTKLSDGEYEELRNICREYISGAVERVVGGDVAAVSSDENVCKYCDFKDFCGKGDESYDDE